MATLARVAIRPPWRLILAIGLLLSVALPTQAFGQTAPSAVPSSAVGQVLLSDDFRSAEAGSLPSSSPQPEDYTVGYEDGEYVIRTVDPDWWGVARAPVPGSYRDTTLTIHVRSIGDQPALVFLECRFGQSGGYAAVLSFDRGFYYLGRWERSRLTRITPLHQSLPARSREVGVDLSLTCAGSAVSLAINGQEGASARDTVYGEGGLRVGAVALEEEMPGTFEVRLSNLRVSQPAPPTETTATATPTATVTPAATAVTPTPTPIPLSEADIAARAAPSVVQVTTRSGSGSGVRVAQGVLTNDHVVSGQEGIEVIRSDGTHQPAAVVRTDPWFDLALLTTDLDLPIVEIEPASAQRQGDPLLVFGYPFGSRLTGSATLTRGILSAVREMDGVTLVQTDAAMNSGSSGGAMVNMRGKLIGISSRGLGTVGGLNFGIAGESIQGFLDGAQIVGPDAAEPDNTVGQARPLTVGANPQLRSLHSAGDVDWVSIAVGAGQSIVLFTDSPTCDTYLRLFGPDGVTQLAEDDDGGSALSAWIEFTAEEGGTYYGQVSHAVQRGTCRSYYFGVFAG
jgi:S1-C subfamily serine protease